MPLRWHGCIFSDSCPINHLRVTGWFVNQLIEHVSGGRRNKLTLCELSVFECRQKTSYTFCIIPRQWNLIDCWALCVTLKVVPVTQSQYMYCEYWWSGDLRNQGIKSVRRYRQLESRSGSKHHIHIYHPYTGYLMTTVPINELCNSLFPLREGVK